LAARALGTMGAPQRPGSDGPTGRGRAADGRREYHTTAERRLGRPSDSLRHELDLEDCSGGLDEAGKLWSCRLAEWRRARARWHRWAIRLFQRRVVEPSRTQLGQGLGAAAEGGSLGWTSRLRGRRADRQLCLGDGRLLRVLQRCLAQRSWTAWGLVVASSGAGRLEQACWPRCCCYAWRRCASSGRLGHSCWQDDLLQ